MESYRRKTSRRKTSKRKSSKKVTFTTADGRRVSFTPKRKSKGPTPSHLKVHTNKMKSLGVKYRNGDFGNMKWKSVVKKHMSKSKSSKPRRSSRRRRSRR